MKVLFIHAHFDDYEFTAAGTFELWRRRAAAARGRKFRAKVLVCTDGKAGHHFRTREETGRVRLEEQAASAKIGKYEFELLKLPNGEAPREACLQITTDFLAALWKAIRDFEPDYIFCPPLASDPLAGIHNDHETVAEAVRRVAYMINVPHAFTPEYPEDEASLQELARLASDYLANPHNLDVVLKIAELYERIEDWESALPYYAWAHHLSGGDSALEEKVLRLKNKTGEPAIQAAVEVPFDSRFRGRPPPSELLRRAIAWGHRQIRSCKVPVILNVYDGYMFGANSFDLAVDVEDVFPAICEMSWCHQSQIVEWLPWVGRHNMSPPASFTEWMATLSARFERKNRELGIASGHAMEVFRVTAWGAVPDIEQLLEDLPGVATEFSRLEALRERLGRWR